MKQVRALEPVLAQELEQVRALVQEQELEPETGQGLEQVQALEPVQVPVREVELDKKPEPGQGLEQVLALELELILCKEQALVQEQAQVQVPVSVLHKQPVAGNSLKLWQEQIRRFFSSVSSSFYSVNGSCLLLCP